MAEMPNFDELRDMIADIYRRLDDVVAAVNKAEQFADNVKDVVEDVVDVVSEVDDVAKGFWGWIKRRF